MANKQLTIGEAIDVTQPDGSTRTLYVKSVDEDGVKFSTTRPLVFGDVYRATSGRFKGQIFVVTATGPHTPMLRRFDGATGDSSHDSYENYQDWFDAGLVPFQQNVRG